MSLWILGEVPQAYHLVAFALIVGGIAVSTSGASAAVRPSRAGVRAADRRQ
jgi:drug/metabolite transporter (DMT)-like permease